MMTQKPTRGRPREFDLEEALNEGQRLFHTHSYEAVGVAALTEALKINPPSFYKAFGSKAAFFDRVLLRYSLNVLPLHEILRLDKSVGDALSELLERAARTYGQDPELRGCLVLEATRGSCDDESVLAARRAARLRRNQIREFVARENRKAAEVVTDYVSSVMSGLSASAREGMTSNRLLKVARAAGKGIEALLAVKSL